MNGQITAAAGALTAALVGATGFARAWVGPRPVLLPDEPQPEPEMEQTQPIHYVVLSDGELTRIFTADDPIGNDFAVCPAEQTTTFHAFRRDGSRKCWTCSTTTPAGAR